jgi:methionine synthase II (cobalamin-independent)
MLNLVDVLITLPSAAAALGFGFASLAVARQREKSLRSLVAFSLVVVGALVVDIVVQGGATWAWRLAAVASALSGVGFYSWTRRRKGLRTRIPSVTIPRSLREL